MKVIVTVACANYLAAAMALSRSVKRHLPAHVFVLCLVEREMPIEAIAYPHFDVRVLAKDLAISDFERSIFRYDVVEACTWIKPALLRWIFNSFPQTENLVYLDPDMLAFRDFDEVWQALGEKNAVLTPHVLDDEPSYLGTKTNLLRALRFGTFNLGFLAISRSKAADELLAWWDNKLQWFCFDEPAVGLFVDQKWMDLAPCLFDVGILKSRAYNVANWNVLRRNLHLASDGSLLIGQTPLALYHFSSFFSGKDLWFLRKAGPELDHAVYRLRALYAAILADLGHEDFKLRPWSYAKFASGETIERKSRVAYRRTPHALARSDIHPFALTNSAFLPET